MFESLSFDYPKRMKIKISSWLFTSYGSKDLKLLKIVYIELSILSLQWLVAHH